ALVADLTAGLGVEGGVIENDLALFARFKFLRTLAALDDSQNLTVIGFSLAITLEDALGKRVVGGVCGLLGRAFPTGPCGRALFFHGAIEARLVEENSL